MLLATPLAPDPRVEKEASFLLSQGHRVVAYAWDRECSHPPREERKGFTIERIRVKSTYGLGLLQVPALMVFGLIAIWRMRRLKPDVIHCHDLETLPLGLLARRLVGGQVVFDAHETHYYSDTNFFRGPTVKLASFLEKLLACKASATIVAEPYQVDRYTKGFRLSGVHLLPNYPQLSLLGQRRTGERQGLAIGRVGSMQKDDGVELLLEAFPRLRAKYPGLRLKLAGATSAPQVMAPKLARMASLGEGVEHVPFYAYDDLPDLYGKIDVAVMPDDPASPRCKYLMPTKFFEALAFGVPVVVSDIGGIGDIVRKEECGIVLDSVTPEAVAEAVDELLQDAERRHRMGERGRRAVEEQFNWDSAVREMLAAYQQTMPAGRGV